MQMRYKRSRTMSLRWTCNLTVAPQGRVRDHTGPVGKIVLPEKHSTPVPRHRVTCFFLSAPHQVQHPGQWPKLGGLGRQSSKAFPIHLFLVAGALWCSAPHALPDQRHRSEGSCRRRSAARSVHGSPCCSSSSESGSDSEKFWGQGALLLPGGYPPLLLPACRLRECSS